MKNPIRRDQQRKKISCLVKKYMFFLLLLFVIMVIHYKSGCSEHSRWETATYSKPTPNTWQYVYEHMSEIVCFSLCGGVFFTLVSELIHDD